MVDIRAVALAVRARGGVYQGWSWMFAMNCGEVSRVSVVEEGECNTVAVSRLW